MSFDGTQIIIYGLPVAVVLLIAWIAYLEVRLRRLTRGKTGADLEETIVLSSNRIGSLEERHEKIATYLKDIEHRVRRSVQGVATVRFNPFKGTGGNHSFATAIVSEDGDGVVLSSLYARDKVTVFAKPIERKNSEHELTDEEREALAQATNFS